MPLDNTAAQSLAETLADADIAEALAGFPTQLPPDFTREKLIEQGFADVADPAKPWLITADAKLKEVQDKLNAGDAAAIARIKASRPQTIARHRRLIDALFGSIVANAVINVSVSPGTFAAPEHAGAITGSGTGTGTIT